MGEKGKQRVGLCYCSTAVAAAAATHIMWWWWCCRSAPSFTLVLPFRQPLFMLTDPHSCLSHCSCACPAACLGSSCLCSLALVCARHHSFILAATSWSSCSLPASFMLISIRLPVLFLFGFHLCSLVLILVSLCFICAHFHSHLFGLGWACLGSSASRLCLYQICG